MNGHIPEDCGRYFKVLALLSDLCPKLSFCHHLLAFMSFQIQTKQNSFCYFNAVIPYIIK